MESRPATYPTISKFLQMLRYLEHLKGRRATVSMLAGELDVSERTINRYAEVLTEIYDPHLGGPTVTIEGRGRDREVCLTRALLVHEERHVFRYAAVWAAARVLSAGAGSTLGDCAEGAVEIVRGALSDNARRFSERVEQIFHYVPFGPKNHRIGDAIIDDLLSAAVYCRAVDVTRRNRRGEIICERLEPWSLVMYRDGLYLLARRTEDDDPASALRTYALERFDEVVIDKLSTFEVPRDFDPAKHFEGRLGLWQPIDDPEQVELAFTPEAAEVLAPRQWPGASAWRDADDGRRVLELMLPITPELMSWIVSWGPQVEVLTPTHLRDRVIDELRLALGQY